MLLEFIRPIAPFASLPLVIGAGWTTLVAADLMVATRGLGFMIPSAAQFLVTDVVIMEFS